MFCPVSPPATTVSISDSEFQEMVDTFYSPDIQILSDTPIAPQTVILEERFVPRLHKTYPEKRSIATQTIY